MFKRYFLLLVLILGACAPTEDATKQAQGTLVAYFDSLSQADYGTTIELYVGSYEGMLGNNPNITPDDRQALWKNACAINGYRCDLLVRTMEFRERTGDEFIFLVEFNNPDGTLFTLGPCCGATETEMPPVSQFEYRVKKTSDGKFVVIDMPVYVP